MFAKIASLKLATRIIALTLAMLLVVVLVNYVTFVRGYRHSAEEAMVEKAAAFTAVADEAKNYVSQLNNDKVFNTQDLLAELQHERESGSSAKGGRILETVPVVAGWTSAREAAKRENIEFRISAFDARNKTNEPEKGSFREAVLRDLVAQVAANPSDPQAQVIHRIDHDKNELHYMRAIKLGENCMMCHGDPGTSTSKDGKDPLGFTMENWKPGQMHGAYEVIVPLAPVDAQVAGFITGGLFWTVPLVLVGSLLFIGLLRATLGRPLAALIARMREIQETNDLTRRVDVRSGDEIGQVGESFNALVTTLHQIIAQVGGSAQEVASAATQIAASSEEMASGMNEQTQQVTQIAAAIEEMSASVVEVARKSTDAAGSASESGKAAEEGGHVVAQTIEGMRAISEAVTTSAASVEELGRRGKEIGQIIEVINEIADQTNLLALNAAIEAARAGEHGRGFAVVADEVRKLADRTTKATEEIAQSIKAIQSETHEAVDRMNTGSGQVRAGMERATEAGQSLKQIVVKAQAVAGMIQSIAAAAEEQSAASEQVSRNVESISAVTRQASEGAGQAASAAAQLSTKAEQLQLLVGRFKVDGSGEKRR